MARITAEELKRRREEYRDEAGRAFDRMMGSDGSGNGLVTFQEREDRACELGDGLTRLLLEEHLAADEMADPEAQVTCPLCGRPAQCPTPERAELQPRKVKMRRGQVKYERAARRCTHCRRVFFPRG